MQLNANRQRRSHPPLTLMPQFGPGSKCGGDMLVNWDRVRVLRDEIGNDDLPEVVGLFLEEGDSVMARLSSPQSASQVEADLHALKGTALNLGFDMVASLCRAAEVAAREGRLSDTATLCTVWRDSKAAFEVGLAAQAA